jgi:2-polyprenyl-6-hydroxyphenyl methylase/3-demethylubiquinone-9 3-methyltransferase
MHIDNDWYDELGDRWWDRDGPVGILHELNGTRFEYFKSVLGALDGVRLLDVGCGGGLLAARMAGEGARVVGADLSHPSLAAAKRHAEAAGLALEFVNARGESLPLVAESFDAVVTSDFLEHVSDLDAVIAECSRLLRPGGLFLYETINRTLLARVTAIWLFERLLGLIPPRTHDAGMFIKPAELHASLARHGIVNRETRGITPEAGTAGALLRLVRERRAGPFKITDNTSISYLGYGVKPDRGGKA